jgi:EAL domain-containing protein (putative c-di-GMP-specific phosphodiesterase class I)/GGDEF domain-containing protein
VLPTLAELIEEAREAITARGEVGVLYLAFGRLAQLEEVYGWEKLDAVLATVASAVTDTLRAEAIASGPHLLRPAVSYPHDEDMVCFYMPAVREPDADAGTDHVPDVSGLVARLQHAVSGRVEEAFGDEISALVEVFVGRSHVTVDPKARLERQIYRGVREAAAAARSVEQRERARAVAELRASLRERAVYIDYHPIVVAESGAVFGYEALARGVVRSLRSPEVMFAIAAQAKLVWELSRLCREKAFEGMRARLAPGQLLFLNVDPHDFADPEFADGPAVLRGQSGGNGMSHDPSQVVIEITERTAIKDYPAFRERLRAFRDRGYRFAVDDAGSGYAGLGSIANLEPDFIKLDISLITGIDSNPIKQRLVETMVRFANHQGAKVIAEGVERAEEFNTVKRLGVHLVQGFFLNEPKQ